MNISISSNGYMGGIEKLKTVFVVISSGIILRNFLAFPGCFMDHIQGKARVVLLVPPDALSHVRSVYQRDLVTVEPVDYLYQLSLLQRLYNFVVSHLNFTDGARLFAFYGVRIDIARSFQNRALYPIKLLISKTLGRFSFFRNAVPRVLDRFLFKERIGKRVFDLYNPDLLFSTNVHHRLDVDLIREARRRDVKTIGMVGSWDHFPKRYEPIRVDALLAWNEPTRQEAITLQGYSYEDIILTGVPYYDIFTNSSLLTSREDFLAEQGLVPERKLIFFASGTVYAPDDEEVVARLIKGIRDDEYLSPVQMHIRPYPGVDEDFERFKRFGDESHVVIDKVIAKKGFADPWIPEIEDIKYFANLLYHSDIVINTVSSTAIEASAFLKPIINIGFDGRHLRPYGESLRRFKQMTHYRHVYETQGTILVEHEKDLIPTVNRFLKDPAYNRENIIRLRDKMCWRIDGNSSARVVSAVLSSLYHHD
jgi:hypothetical protein